ncbi:MAG: BA14K family protein [Bauldia sp.]
MRKLSFLTMAVVAGGLALAASAANAQTSFGFGFGFGNPGYYGQTYYGYYPQNYYSYPQYSYGTYGYGYGWPQTYAYPQATYPQVATNDHVAWCQARYRSYNVQTDSFTGYDGRLHRCESPY